MKEFTLNMPDGMPLSVALFEAAEPKALIQIIHGAKEHKERYYGMSRFFNEQGYTVLLSDNRGHGRSVNEAFPLGHMEGVEQLVTDQLHLTHYLKDRAPGKPLFLYGHSFGTLIARCYLQKHDDEIDKLLMSGAANYLPLSGIGLILGSLFAAFKGKKGVSPFLERLSGLDGRDISWVVKNETERKAYQEDPYCVGYPYTIGALRTISQADHELKQFAHYRCKNPALPVLSLSGEEDPITGGEKGLRDTLANLSRIGYQNIRRRVYPGMRHEIHHEHGCEQVYRDMVAFFEGAEEKGHE